MRSLAAVAIASFVAALVVFALARPGSEPKPPLPKVQALPSALRDAGVRSALRGTGWDSSRVIPLDGDNWRVTFLAGPRYVLDAAVGRDGRVSALETHPKNRHPFGSDILWNPALLVLLVALFVAALAVKPLANIRNLDALVVGAGFTLSAVFLDERLVGAYVYMGAACLAYAAIRCFGVALRDPRAQTSTSPLLPDHRLVRVATAAAFVAALVVVISSNGIADVAYAGLAGGTLLNHGLSPYSHLTDVVHGDTYPLLTYVLYMPFAALSPVRDGFDSLDGSLWLNAIALAAAAVLLARNGTSHVLAWLAFPPVLLSASRGGNDVPTAVFVVGALATASRTQLSVALLALAGWVKIGPAAALVPWLARLRGAPLARALALVAAPLLAGAAAIALIGGFHEIDRAVTALRFQLDRGSWFSLWRQVGSPALQVALEALTVTAAVAAAVVARRDPDLSLGRLAALGGALVAVLQLSASYWSFAYLPWLLPFILVALFPPVRQRSPQPAQPAP